MTSLPSSRPQTFTAPTFVGWSYGSRVIKLHISPPMAPRIWRASCWRAASSPSAARARTGWSAPPPGLDRDLYTDDLPRRLHATARFVEGCTTDPLDRTTYAELVGVNMLCPAHARRALFAADLDLRPTYTAMTCPGLVIHGLADRVVAHETGRVAADLMPDGRFIGYERIGHAPFLGAS